MAEGASVVLANDVLAAALQGVSFARTAAWVQLHVGAPGPSGTANIAVETTRINAFGCFGTAPSGGAITNSGAVGTWTAVTGSETYTHFSIWSASTSGTFNGISGTVTAAPVTVGDDFDAPAGTFTVTLPVAA